MADQEDRDALLAQLRALREELALREREQRVITAWLRDLHRSRVYRFLHGIRNLFRRLLLRAPIPLPENVLSQPQGPGGIDMLGLDPWLPGLRHGRHPTARFPLVVWGVGASREQISRACESVGQHIAEQSDWAPILITDRADFAHYSRLGWLVEYLPRAMPSGTAGERGPVLGWEEKFFHLARLYRGAPVVPAVAPDGDGDHLRLLLRWVQQAYDY